MVKFEEHLLQLWKEIIINRKSLKNVKRGTIETYTAKKSRTVRVQNLDIFKSLVNYCINTFETWNIASVRSFLGFEDIETNTYEIFWEKTRCQFLEKFSEGTYTLKKLNNTLRKKNLEKVLIFCKLPKICFNISTADLLIKIYEAKIKIKTHKTKSFCESTPLKNKLIDETFWKEEKIGVLDIKFKINDCQEEIKNFKNYFDAVFTETALNEDVHVLLKTAGYVTQWHFDVNNSPMIVIYHQLKGTSFFMGVPSVYGYYFLAKAQSGDLNLEDLLSHFHKIKGKVHEDTVLKENKKEHILVEEGDIIAVFPSAMHQVHVPDDSPQSIVIALEYTLKELRNKIRMDGFYHEHEVPTKKRKR